MLKINIKELRIEVDYLLIISIIISIFSLKFRNFIMSYYACYLFIIFHELSHIFIASFFECSLKVFRFTISGVNVSFNEDLINSSKSFSKKVLIYIAGPISNFIFAFIFRDIKMIFEINIFLGILNLLPIYPLDGYNLIYLLIIKTSNNTRIIRIIQNLFIIFFLFLGIIQIIFYKSFSLIIFSIYIFLLKNRL